MIIRPEMISSSIRRDRKRFLAKLLISFSFLVLVTDLTYKSYFGITYQTRDKCILYRAMPKWAFSLYENFIELLLIVIAGIFVAVLIEKYFSRLKRIIPKSPWIAFIYASILPVCSCSAVPLIRAVGDKIPFRTVITFVVAAPLLNPYIIILSVSVIGVEYTIVRVLCSLILAVATGYIVERFWKRRPFSFSQKEETCKSRCCSPDKSDVVMATFNHLKKILPFLLIAGALGVGVELFAPSKFLRSIDLSNNIMGLLIVVLVGVPVYFCNGADVLFIQPLMQYSSLPLGTAMAFSLTSTSVCVTSLVLLIKYIGKRLTAVLLASIVVLTIILSFIVQEITLLIKMGN